jgi:hypothetical protein
MAHPTVLLRTMTAPGTPDTLPTTVLIGTLWTQIEPYTHVMVTFEQATNGAPTTQLADHASGTTADVTIATQRGGCMSIDLVMTAQRLVRRIEVPLQADAQLGVYLSALTNPNGSTQRVNIHVTPYRS